MQARTAQILEDYSCRGNCSNTYPKSGEWFVQVNFRKVNEFVMIVKMLLDPE